MPKPDNVKCVLFLYITGEKVVEGYNILTFTKAEEGKYNAFVHELKGKKDLAHERYVFNNRD